MIVSVNDSNSFDIMVTIPHRSNEPHKQAKAHELLPEYHGGGKN